MDRIRFLKTGVAVASTFFVPPDWVLGKCPSPNSKINIAVLIYRILKAPLPEGALDLDRASSLVSLAHLFRPQNMQVAGSWKCIRASDQRFFCGCLASGSELGC